MKTIGLTLLLAGLMLTATTLLERPQKASAQCAFPFVPTTYEDFRDRQLYLNSIELAAYNMLFPGDPYFGLPNIEVGTRGNRSPAPGFVPPLLLKSIAYIESSITQGASSTPFGSIGPALISFDCGHGITQVTTGMTLPAGEGGRGSPQQAAVATHFAYNIARGAWWLVTKWNEAPEARPIAGTDTGADPSIMENWYFAVWAYNGFTGPGANRSNHPLDPIYGAWPRTPYSCGPVSDGLGHNRNAYPYQELIFGCAANPPLADGQPLWEAQPITLPNLNDPAFAGRLALGNFVFPYSRMDIPTPQPYHVDTTPPPPAALRDQILGSPRLFANKTRIGYWPAAESTPATINVRNRGTGVMAWYAVSPDPWITLSPYTGVAVGYDVPCEQNVPCDRIGRMQVVINPALAPPGVQNGTIFVHMLGSDQVQVVEVYPRQ